MSQTSKANIQDIKNLLKDDLIIIDKQLKNLSKNQSQLIIRVVENIFSGGGKRIRPILHILTGKLLQEQALNSNFYYLGAAIELIHCATLLHDDVIDNSDLRRGKKTANNIFDNKAAILVGDFLFAESFKLMVKTNSTKALNILATASSLISQGEVKQLELKKQDFISKQEYFSVIEAKTAILFAAATESAACLAAQDEQICKNLKEFGLNLGLAFQIIDDILDYKADASLLGKDIGDDFFEQKITLPIILLEAELDGKQKEDLKQLFSKQYKANNEDLEKLVKLLNKYDIFTKSFAYANNYVQQSLQILKSFPENQARFTLESICNIIISREY